MSNETWLWHETRSKLWRAIAAAGPAGAKRKALLEHVGKSSTSLDWHTTNMQRDGYIRRVLAPNGRIRWGLWTVGERTPPIEGALLDKALAVLDDCPQGVGQALLCQELGVNAQQLQETLAPAEEQGMFQRMQMPPQHGGGLGWCKPRTALQGIPVYEVDIDAVHRRREPFAVQMSDGKLSITHGALHMALSQQQTDQVVRCVLAEVAR